MKKSSKKKQVCQTDYRMWFIIGIVWMVAGLPLAITSNNYGLFAIGIVFAIMGIMHRKDWGKYQKPKWEDLSKGQKRAKIIAFVLSIIFIIAISTMVIVNLVK